MPHLPTPTSHAHDPLDPLQAGGGGGCQGTISTEIMLEGEKFATSRDPRASLLFPGVLCIFPLFPDGLWMIAVISGWAPDPLASEFAVKLLVILRENFAAFLTTKCFPAKFCPPKHPPRPCTPHPNPHNPQTSLLKRCGLLIGGGGGRFSMTPRQIVV